MQNPSPNNNHYPYIDEDEIDIRELFRILRSNIRFIAIFTGIVLILTIIYVLTRPKIYEAKCQVMLPQDKASMLAQYGVIAAAMGINIDGSSGSFKDILKSRKNLEQLVDLVIEWKKKDGSWSEKPGIIYRFKEFLGWPPFSRDIIIDGMINSIDKAINIDTDKKSPGILNISLEWPKNRERALVLLRRLIKNTQEYANEMRRKGRGDVLSFIRARIKEQEVILRKREEALRDFQMKNGFIVIEKEAEALIDRLTEYTAKLESARLQKGINKRELEAIRNKLPDIERDIITSKSEVRNPVITNLKQQLADLMVKIESLLKQDYRETHPEIVKLRKQVESIKARIKNEVEKVYGGTTISINPLYQEFKNRIITIQVRLMVANASINAYNKLLQKYQDIFNSLPDKSLRFMRLKRDVSIAGEVYLLLIRQLEKAQIDYKNDIREEQIITPPYIKPLPVKPRVKLIIVVAGATAVILAVFLVFIMHFFKGYINESILVSHFRNMDIIKTTDITHHIRVLGSRFKDAMMIISNADTKIEDAFDMTNIDSWVDRVEGKNPIVLIFSEKNTDIHTLERVADIFSVFNDRRLIIIFLKDI